MKINKVTITGADNKVNPRDLLRLQKDYPFVEWGILFSKSKAGKQRYPSPEWIQQCSELPLNLSAHFCGWYARQVIDIQNYSLIHFLNERFSRVQINYSFGSTTGLYKLINYLELHPIKEIIIQYNKTNEPVIDQLEDFPDKINFLYDSSGGRGTVIREIDAPFGNYTGYSGGIDGNNIEAICKKIKNNWFKETVWIDLESGARTNNDFDLEKVGDILEKVKRYVDFL